MLKFLSKRAFIVVNVFAMLMPFHGQAAGLCSEVFTAVEAPRGYEPPKVDWKSDRSYIEGAQFKETFGQVATHFSSKWDTQIYHSNTGQPDAAGRSPLVDPAAKAVVIFFHGSGTSKSSGRNFISNMNVLSNMGYSSLAFDMPFHAQGPTSVAFNKANHFMEWVRQIVLEARKSGKPVYLAGHSFGPDVALEYATRYPNDIAGVIGLSPAGFTKELSHWYDNYTTKMTFGGAVAENAAGGIWAGNMSSQFHWAKRRLADPTVVNPELKIRILSGNREEYVPAPIGGENKTPIGDNTYDISIPLKQTFRNVTVTIEPGVGHYLFDAVDRNGYNVVMRELLLGMGEHPANIKKMIEETRAENVRVHISGQVAKKYAQDPIFKAWADMTYGPKTVMKITRQGQDRFAQKMLEDFVEAQRVRDAEIFQKILDSKNTHPEFYEKYKVQIDALNPKKPETTLFNPYLAHVLSKTDGQQ